MKSLETQAVWVRLPKKLVKDIDLEAEKRMTNRGETIKAILVRYIANKHLQR